MMRTRCIDVHLSRLAQKTRLAAVLHWLGEDIDGSESITYLLRVAQCYGFDGERFLDRDIVIFWY